MKIICDLRTYDDSPVAKIQVESHWNQTGFDGLVEICIGDQKVAVSTHQLKEAVERCSGFRK